MSPGTLPGPDGLDLPALLADPQRAVEIPAEQIPAVLAQLTGLQGALLARLLLAGPIPNVPPDPVVGGDRLLTAEEAATRLGVSTDWIYRRATKLPFTVRLGARLRFSTKGIERYIRQREGR